MPDRWLDSRARNRGRYGRIRENDDFSKTRSVREVTLRYGGAIDVEVLDGTCGRPARVADWARQVIGDDVAETFLCLMLDARNNALGHHVVSRGTLTASLVHPRETFRAAIVAGAASVVIAHNHPSGEVSPSVSDGAVTRRLVRAGELLGISVLDHVIVTSTDEFYSYRESDPAKLATETR